MSVWNQIKVEGEEEGKRGKRGRGERGQRVGRIERRDEIGERRGERGERGEEKGERRKERGARRGEQDTKFLTVVSLVLEHVRRFTRVKWTLRYLIKGEMKIFLLTERRKKR